MVEYYNFLILQLNICENCKYKCTSRLRENDSCFSLNTEATRPVQTLTVQVAGAIQNKTNWIRVLNWIWKVQTIVKFYRLHCRSFTTNFHQATILQWRQIADVSTYLSFSTKLSKLGKVIIQQIFCFPEGEIQCKLYGSNWLAKAEICTGWWSNIS